MLTLWTKNLKTKSLLHINSQTSLTTNYLSILYENHYCPEKKMSHFKVYTAKQSLTKNLYETKIKRLTTFSNEFIINAKLLVSVISADY